MKTIGFEQMISLPCCFSFQAVQFIVAQPGNYYVKLLKNSEIAGDVLQGEQNAKCNQRLRVEI